MIYNEKIDELEQALTSKADSNHNHDDTYLKKTDASSTYATKTEMNNGLAGKAASNHSHAFSAITGSMDITDSRLTGNLPVARVTGAATAPTYYTTSAGTWIETTLSNGRTILEGGDPNSRIESNGILQIDLPKNISILSFIASYFGSVPIETPSLAAGGLGTLLFVVGKPNEYVGWYLKGYF